MNSPAATHPLPSCALPLPTLSQAHPRTPWNRFILSLGILASVALTGVLTLVLALVLSLRMGGEARTLRRAVFAATPDAWEPQLEIGVGRLPAWIARTGVKLADPHLDLPTEALAGIASFRSADVGIYHRNASAPTASKTETLAHVDAAMTARDWEPVVSVHDGQETVLVFLPKDLHSLRDARACVFVMQKDQLVIVSARLDLDPLIGLIQQKLPHLVSH